MAKNVLIYLLLLLLNTLNLYSQESKMSLNSGWKFRHAVDTEWYPASVPGCVHLDQMANRIIGDPFFRDNEKNLQWIENEDWVYQKTFEITDIQLIANDIELVFEGLDTYTSISLNGLPILQTDNMFRTWRYNVKNVIRPGINTLEVHFFSAVNKGKELAKKLTYTLPGDEKVFTRKAQYQYGWDWGPRFVTCGIWRPVYLNFITGPVFKDVFVRQNKITAKKAEITVQCTIQANNEEKYSIKIVGASHYRFSIDTTLVLSKGTNIVNIPINIEQPALWNPNSGSSSRVSSLTSLDLDIRKGKEIFHSKDITIGLHSIELVQEKDSIGNSFYFKVNGKPVFIKGANYIPPDNFMSRPDSSVYYKLVMDAYNSNINMLRVWGGGNYECDYFYTLCDEMGIMIWQDFMFACAMYPGDTAFLNNVKSEAIDNITRLRNHASIALWCGNNEIDEGWHNWGWQKQYNYSATDSARIWNDYLTIFEKILPETVHSLDPGIAYWPSSPSIGWGHKEALASGDSHYWGVWWGMEPFETYEKKVPRFMSEYGFQGFPDINTTNAFTDKQDRYLGSPVMKVHQKHPTGYETIKTYMEREYKVPSGLEDYTYVSQILQSEGIRKAIEAQRRAKPRCMGTLYWQFNDCWPVVSWSGRDSYGRWKALQFAVKRAFEPFIVSIYQDSTDKIGIYLINDNAENVTGKLDITLLDINGNKLYSKGLKNVEVSNKKNTVVFLDPKEYAEALYLACKENCVLKAVFTETNKNESFSNQYYFVKPKDMELTNDISLDIKPISMGLDKNNSNSTLTQYTLTLKAHKLSRNIWLQVEGADAIFSDNNFDMMPGEIRTIVCKPADFKNPVNIRSIKARSLADPLK